MSFKNNDTRSQNNKVIFNVYNYLKNLATSDDEVLKQHFKQTQKITADACGASLMTVRRVCAEGFANDDVSDSPQPGPSFRVHREKRINEKNMPQSWTISIAISYEELCMNFMKKVNILHQN